MHGILRLGSKILQKTGLADVKIGGSRVRTRVARLLLPIVVRRIPNPASVEGFAIHHGGSVSRSLYAYTSKDYEPGTVRAFKTILRPGDTVYDVGAHIGFFTLIAASLVGSEGRVFAFEASAETVVWLRKNVEANGYGERVEVSDRAIADREGVLDFSGSDRDSSARGIQDAKSGSGLVQVASTTLDSHWRKSGRTPVRLLKIDVEGFELESLRHGGALLDASPDCVVVAEARTHDQSGRSDYESISKLLSRYDLTRAHALWDDGPMELIGENQLPETERFRYVNVAFSRVPLD